MKPFLSACGILFEAHLWRCFRTRRGWIALGLALLPVGLGGVVSLVSHREGPIRQDLLIALVWGLMVQLIVPVVAMVMASSVVAEEIEDRTITYLFTRPIPRAAILVGRWLAIAAPIAVILCGAAELLLRFVGRTGPADGAVAWMPEGFHPRYLAAVFLGSLAYSGLFAAAGALVKRPMLVGLAYTLLYEGVLGNLPGSSQSITVQFYLKSIVFGPFAPLGGDGSLRSEILTTPLAGTAESVRMLLLFLVGGLALGALRFSKREYVLTA